MKITREEQRSLADRLAEILHIAEYDPQTMTTSDDLAASLGVSKEIAEKELDRLVEAGTMEKTEARRNGRRRQVWIENRSQDDSNSKS